MLKRVIQGRGRNVKLDVHGNDVFDKCLNKGK